MAIEIPIKSTPYPVAHLPFANESQLQRFVEDHSEEILGLTIVASARRGGRRLFDIDILAVDSENAPFVIECKWDVVDAGALRQLAGYSRVLERSWAVFEDRVGAVKGQSVRIQERQPVLVAIGYRYDPTVVAGSASVICLSYAHHGVTFREICRSNDRPDVDQVVLQHSWCVGKVRRDRQRRSARRGGH